MIKTIEFGGQKRKFMFSTWVTRILTDRYPGDILKELEKAPIDTWMDIGHTCLLEGEEKTREDIPVKDYYLWFDEATDETKQEIRKGVKLCTNFGSTDDDLSEDFQALWAKMNDQEKEACKKIVLGKSNQNGKQKKAEVEAGTK